MEQDREDEGGENEVLDTKSVDCRVVSWTGKELKENVMKEKERAYR
jgi:hypothetical protein